MILTTTALMLSAMGSAFASAAAPALEPDAKSAAAATAPAVYQMPANISKLKTDLVTALEAEKKFFSSSEYAVLKETALQIDSHITMLNHVPDLFQLMNKFRVSGVKINAGTFSTPRETGEFLLQKLTDPSFHDTLSPELKVNLWKLLPILQMNTSKNIGSTLLFLRFYCHELDAAMAMRLMREKSILLAAIVTSWEEDLKQHDSIRSSAIALEDAVYIHLGNSGVVVSPATSAAAPASAAAPSKK